MDRANTRREQSVLGKRRSFRRGLRVLLVKGVDIEYRRVGCGDQKQEKQRVGCHKAR